MMYHRHAWSNTGGQIEDLSSEEFVPESGHCCYFLNVQSSDLLVLAKVLDRLN